MANFDDTNAEHINLGDWDEEDELDLKAAQDKAVKKGAMTQDEYLKLLDSQMARRSSRKGMAAILENLKSFFGGKKKQGAVYDFGYDVNGPIYRTTTKGLLGNAEAGRRINPDYTSAVKYKRKELEIPVELRQEEKLKDPEIAKSLKNWYEPVYDSNWTWEWKGSGWLPAKIPYSVLRDEYNWAPSAHPPVRLVGGKVDKWKLALVWNDPTRLCASYVRCDGIYGLRLSICEMLAKVDKKNKKLSLFLRRVILFPLPKHVKDGIELGGIARRTRLVSEKNADLAEMLGGLWGRG